MTEERNLRLFKGSKKIRELPSVILGSDGIRGVQQTLFEIITNAIDRYKAGYGDKVIITRHKDDSYTIQDFADGLPVLWIEKDKIYNWDIALNKLYGGDNYALTQEELDKKDLDGKLGNYGLGLASTQMASEYMNVTVRKQNKKYVLKFKEGRPIDKNTFEFVKEDTDEPFTKEEGEKVIYETINNDGFTGTIINYKPDSKVFTDINIDSNWIKNKLNTQATVCCGITLIFNDEKNDEYNEYKYESIDDYICKNISDKKDDVSDTIHFYNRCNNCKDGIDKLTYKMDYDLTFKFNKSIQRQEFYHNSSELTELTFNVTTKGLQKGLTTSIHNYITRHGLYKKKEKVNFDDISDSLIAILITRSTKTSYANQTKLSIDNPFIQKYISDEIIEKFTTYLEENEFEANKIINQILINMRANNKAETSKLNLKKELEKGANSAITRPDKFTPCVSKDRKKICLILTEGDSAKEPMRKARDKNTMALYALRGKVINALKNDLNDILKNNEVKDIFKILQCGMEYKGKSIKGINKYDENNLAYDNVSIAVDADEDGKHIRSLIICLFYVLAPDFIKNGHLYSLLTPLYKIESKKQYWYAYTESEKDEIIKNIQGKYSLKRFKGLGSLTTPILAETAMSEENRILERITWDDAEKCKEALMLCMSDERQKERKEFIETHGNEYFDIKTLEV